jgi:hypothetical protein
MPNLRLKPLVQLDDVVQAVWRQQSAPDAEQMQKHRAQAAETSNSLMALHEELVKTGQHVYQTVQDQVGFHMQAMTSVSNKLICTPLRCSMLVALCCRSWPECSAAFEMTNCSWRTFQHTAKGIPQHERMPQGALEW